MMVENGTYYFSFVLVKERDKVEDGLGSGAQADIGNRSPVYVPSSPIFVPSSPVYTPSSRGTVMLENWARDDA